MSLVIIVLNMFRHIKTISHVRVHRMKGYYYYGYTFIIFFFLLPLLLLLLLMLLLLSQTKWENWKIEFDVDKNDDTLTNIVFLWWFSPVDAVSFADIFQHIYSRLFKTIRKTRTHGKKTKPYFSLLFRPIQFLHVATVWARARPFHIHHLLLHNNLSMSMRKMGETKTYVYIMNLIRINLILANHANNHGIQIQFRTLKFGFNSSKVCVCVWIECYAFYAILLWHCCWIYFPSENPILFDKIHQRSGLISEHEHNVWHSIHFEWNGFDPFFIDHAVSINTVQYLLRLALVLRIIRPHTAFLSHTHTQRFRMKWFFGCGWKTKLK